MPAHICLDISSDLVVHLKRLNIVFEMVELYQQLSLHFILALSVYGNFRLTSIMIKASLVYVSPASIEHNSRLSVAFYRRLSEQTNDTRLGILS